MKSGLWNVNYVTEKTVDREFLPKLEKYIKSVTDRKGRPRKIHNQEETDRKAVSAAINRRIHIEGTPRSDKIVRFHLKDLEEEFEARDRRCVCISSDWRGYQQLSKNSS